MNGYSDWEYYSDDYYDDDQSLLKNNPQEGSPLQRSKAKKSNNQHRGKKRKLLATSDIPDLSLIEDSKPELRSMGPWFKGTVWKTSAPEKTEKKLYQPGMGERVALLGNWREVFRANQPTGGKSRKGSPITQQRGHMHTNTRAKSLSSETARPEKANINASNEGVEPREDETEGPKDRKRPRTSFEGGRSYPVKNKVVVEIPVQRANGLQKGGPENQKQTGQKPSSSRKRKADDVNDENANEEQSKPRAKRVASGKAPLKPKEKEKPPPLPAARITRSRRK
jgi:hypothetical protein